MGKLQMEEDPLPKPAYPGFLVLLAPDVFKGEKVEIAIIESGTGGEIDSTNSLSSPVATGITEIGLDHLKTLGIDFESTAWHKAGILKVNVPAYTVFPYCLRRRYTCGHNEPCLSRIPTPLPQRSVLCVTMVNRQKAHRSQILLAVQALPAANILWPDLSGMKLVLLEDCSLGRAL